MSPVRQGKEDSEWAPQVELITPWRLRKWTVTTDCLLLALQLRKKALYIVYLDFSPTLRQTYIIAYVTLKPFAKYMCGSSPPQRFWL